MLHFEHLYNVTNIRQCKRCRNCFMYLIKHSCIEWRRNFAAWSEVRICWASSMCLPGMYLTHFSVIGTDASCQCTQQWVALLLLFRSAHQPPIATEKLNHSIWDILSRYHILINNHLSANTQKMTVCSQSWWKMTCKALQL